MAPRCSQSPLLMLRAKIVAKLCTPLSACLAWKDRASQHKELLSTPHGMVLACAGAAEGPITEEGVVDIIYHWGSPHNLLFLGPGFHMWTSNDFGETFTELDTPGRTLGESMFRGHAACWLPPGATFSACCHEPNATKYGFPGGPDLQASGHCGCWHCS